MAETTARDLADYILIASSNRAGTHVTNLKLQKLLYYCQAWHLALMGSALFSERIEAWVHGPVVPPVFGIFKVNRWAAIPIPNIAPNLDLSIREHVAEVLNAYGDLTGLQLEALTHQEDPWRLAREGVPPDAASTSVISHESMRVYYQSKLV